LVYWTNFVTWTPGCPFLSFRGLGYAEPPIGPLRFARPVPAKAWTGLKAAIKYGPDCLQLDMVTRLVQP
jgi:para-nitrobenzyl esterase